MTGWKDLWLSTGSEWTSNLHKARLPGVGRATRWPRAVACMASTWGDPALPRGPPLLLTAPPAPARLQASAPCFSQYVGHCLTAVLVQLRESDLFYITLIFFLGLLPSTWYIMLCNFAVYSVNDLICVRIVKWWPVRFVTHLSHHIITISVCVARTFKVYSQQHSNVHYSIVTVL